MNLFSATDEDQGWGATLANRRECSSAVTGTLLCEAPLVVSTVRIPDTEVAADKQCPRRPIGDLLP